MIPVWNRPDVFKLCISQLEKVCGVVKYDITCLFILSIEDSCFQELFQIYENANISKKIIYASNGNLGEKHNHGIREFLRNEYDYLMNLGSDDLVHENLFDLYADYIDKEVKFFGINSVIFYEKDKLPIFFRYKSTTSVIGAGRMIHKSILKHVMSHYGCVYPPTAQRGLDGLSGGNIRNLGYVCKIVPTNLFPYIVDVKSDVNINSYERIKMRNKHNVITFYDKEYLKKQFNYFKKINHG